MKLYIKMAFGAYHGAWRIVAPYLHRNKRLADGFDERVLKKALPTPVDVWLHAASTGEAYLATDLARVLLKKTPCSVLVTTQTGQGRQILEQFATTHSNGNIQHHYLPLDMPPLMNRFVAAVNPRAVVLLETELWPSMLRALKMNGSRVMIANGRITRRSFGRLKWVSSIWRMLAPDQVLATSEGDAKRFAALFNCPVRVVANMKFDQLEYPPPELNISKTDLCSQKAALVVLGSVRIQEAQAVEKIIVDLTSKTTEFTIALYPKHIHQMDVWETLLSKIKIPFQHRSQMTAPAVAGSVILGDTIGELRSIYGVADAVFVGGSLAPLGGQNFLEPLLYGRRTVIGPYWDNFKWVGPELFNQELVKVAHTPMAAASTLRQLLEQPGHEQCQAAVQHYLTAQKGGTDQTIKELIRLLSTGEKR